MVTLAGMVAGCPDLSAAVSSTDSGGLSCWNTYAVPAVQQDFAGFGKQRKAQCAREYALSMAYLAALDAREMVVIIWMGLQFAESGLRRREGGGYNNSATHQQAPVPEAHPPPLFGGFGRPCHVRKINDLLTSYERALALAFRAVWISLRCMAAVWRVDNEMLRASS